MRTLPALALISGLALGLANLPVLAHAASPSTAPAAAPTAAPTAPSVVPGSLGVGDKAPALAIDQWVKGEAISGFEQGKIYVVEFWATWCGPCIRAKPILVDLQKKYADKGVSIIGVTSQDTRGNTLEAVQKMIKSKPDSVNYRIAWDQGRTTNTNYMVAAAQRGIPTAFIVDRSGTIAWIGSPYQMAEPLGKIVAGSWDVNAARDAFKKEQASAVAMMNFRTAARSGNRDDVLKHARALVETQGTDADTMNMVSWTIVSPESKLEVKANDELALLALDAAERANNASGGNDPGTLDTLARAQFVNKRINDAIATQTKAVRLAKDDQTRALLQATLNTYTSTPR